MGVVIYNEALDKIIREEAKKSPDNLAESFRNSAERIEKEHGIKDITDAKVSTRYYTLMKKDKQNSRGKSQTSRSKNGNGAKASTPKKTSNGKRTTVSKAVKTVEPGTNVTEDLADEKYQTVKGFASKLSKERKLQLVQELWTDI